MVGDILLRPQHSTGLITVKQRDALRWNSVRITGAGDSHLITMISMLIYA